jgi:two-component system, OmpR family, heavy metal sensor histidine kinase CusS
MSSKTLPIKPKPASAPPRPWSIARRLTLFYVATTAVLLVAAAAYLYWTQVTNLKREDTDFLVNKIEDCRRVLQERPSDPALLTNEVQVEAAASLIKYYVGIQDEQGRVRLETAGMSNLFSATSFPAPAGTGAIPARGKLWKSPSGRAFLLMSAQAPTNPEQSRTGLVRVALDVSPEEALITGYRHKLLAVVLLGCSFAWLTGALLTRKGLQPLKAITAATERVTAHQLQERIVAHGWPVELTALARSFDGMLDRLQDSFTRLSQFSADLAHELRTPINNLRGEAGVALSKARTAEEYRRTLESSLEEYARLARLIENMLFLARAEGAAANHLARSSFDARKEIQAVCEFYEALAEDRGVEVRCEGDGTLNADPLLFRQAMSNLLSNALNYTNSGGRILFQLRVLEDRGLDVCISDTGCGIAPEHLPHIFDRLYRADSSRSRHPDGAGLGLAIVKSIMTLHHGTVQAQSAVARGTTITLSFPSVASLPTPT